MTFDSPANYFGIGFLHMYPNLPVTTSTPVVTSHTGTDQKRRLRIARYLLEITVIAVFVVWVTWPYLGGTPSTALPAGGDFVVSIQGRFFWNHVRECGSCALWNGDIAGGSPALIDTSTDMLHPLVAGATLMLGVLEASRLLIALTLFISGIGSWWLAYLLGISSFARVFAGCVGAAGGHMTGRLSFGLVVLITSIATASLLIPAAILFSRRPGRRSTALLGGLLGITILSGQAYIQIGVLLLAPAGLLLLVRNGASWQVLLQRLIQVGAIALSIASILVVPVMHYRSIVGKDFDPYFSRSQAFKYVPLNLVIDRRDYFSSSMFNQPGFPAWHVNYIGWIALGFVALGTSRLWAQSRHEALFLGALAIGALWLGSGSPFSG